jgi:hypothetical protein
MTREDHARFTHIVESWLDSPDDFLDPNSVLDRAMAQVETRPQRRARWPEWRIPLMNKFVTIGLGAAAVVVLLFVGVQLLGSNPDIGDAPSPSAEPAATATPRPSATTTPEPTRGSLPEGPFVLVYPELLGVRMTVTIPGPDWHGFQTETFIEKHGTASPPQGAGLSVWGADMLVYGDPCAWESTRPDDPAASLDELVASLSAQASREATAPVDVTVGGYPGKMLTLHVPEDAVFADCDGGEFRTLVEVETGDAPIQQGPGQIDEVWVVDVDGTLIFIDVGYFAATPAEDVEEMREMVESATFEVP